MDRTAENSVRKLRPVRNTTATKLVPPSLPASDWQQRGATWNFSWAPGDHTNSSGPLHPPSELLCSLGQGRRQMQQAHLQPVRGETPLGQLLLEHGNGHSLRLLGSERHLGAFDGRLRKARPLDLEATQGLETRGSQSRKGTLRLARSYREIRKASVSRCRCCARVYSSVHSHSSSESTTPPSPPPGQRAFLEKEGGHLRFHFFSDVHMFACLFV